MARIVHFDFSGDHPDKLIPFYQKIFDWKFQKWEGPMEYWLVTTGPDGEPGINGGLTKRQQDNRVVNTIAVEDIDAVVEKIKDSGGKIVTEKGAIPGVGWFAQFEDPEENIFGLMQNDTDAR